MLASIRAFFEQQMQPGREADKEHSLQLATATLLLEVSRADFHVDDDELAVVTDSLRSLFAFSEEETQRLLELAREETEQALSLHPFVRLVNEQFTPEDRQRIMELLWQVAYADGRIDKYEEYQIRKIADLIYVPHSVFIRAKHRAAEQAGH